MKTARHPVLERLARSRLRWSIAVPEAARKLAELRDIRAGVQRALVDIWKGARLVRDGVDVTEAHRGHLQGVVADIDAEIAAYEDGASGGATA
jgi:hypothetical protein